MRSYEVEYVDTDGEIVTIEVEVGDDEGPEDAKEEARTLLTEDHPSVDTDEWDIRSASRIVPVADEVEIYRYDSDVAPQYYAVDVDDETIHLTVEADASGNPAIALNAGYAEGSEENDHERAVFEANRDAIVAAARLVLAGPSAPAPRI